MSLLLEAFDNLPEPGAADDLELWEAGAEDSIREFRELAEKRDRAKEIRAELQKRLGNSQPQTPPNPPANSLPPPP